jgi:hypothetical protein
MTRAGGTVVAIAIGVTLAAGSQVAIKEGRAQSQPRTASAVPTIWDHNGSVMYLAANGSSREFYYQKPRPGMLDAGARPGSLLFRGEVNDGQYSGTAYIFNAHCGPIPFQVKGSSLDNDERIMLTGQVPRVGRDCHAYETSTTNLEFRRIKPNEGAQSQEGITPRKQESKPEVPSTVGGEPPRSLTQPTAPTGSTSHGASVYVAGKGKYCKETGVSGYLDCFYASMEACQKHNNKFANVRCVVNPNSGS